MKFFPISDWYYDFKLRKRIREIENLLTVFFNHPVKLKKLFRKSSRDNIYKILSGGKVVAVARVRNKLRLKNLANSDKKYNRAITDSKKRFQREWEKCQKAWPHKLTPEPLLRGDDFLVLKFVEGRTALEEISRDNSKIQFIIERILEASRHIHQLNIFHGDLSIFNCIITNENRCVFFDLENKIPDFSLAADKIVFEYFHLIDTSLKFLSQDYRNIDFWAQLLGKHGSPMAKGADIDAFREKFKRLEGIDPEFKKLKKVFHQKT